jgi:bidirectional [NiFe] hydrogenase diaphorase subunit
MDLITTTIDGKDVEVQRDRWALDVAREMGIEIPTLCHHPALEPYGACRLCVVEVTKGKWTWLTTSCDLPIREGLTIRTDTPEVIKSRKTTLELLLTLAPNAEQVRLLAEQMGLETPRFADRVENNSCILCGLCVRACRAVTGKMAICFLNRGVDRVVGPPFDRTSKECIGCNVCAEVCPTGYIQSQDEGDQRKIATLKTDLELACCDGCGKPFAPVKQLEHIQEKIGEKFVAECVCSVCRRKKTAAKLHEITEKLS